MKCALPVLALALSAAATGFMVRPAADDAIFAYVETCDRSPLANPMTGRYRPKSPFCRAADAYIYGTEPIELLEAQALTCKAAALAPTDGAIEACMGRPWWE